MVDGDGVTGDERPPAVVVYWRPGCFFCVRLLGAFERRGVRHERRNIWADDEARAFVRAHNRGDETVPTVALGSDVRTNPDPRSYVDDLQRTRPDLVAHPAETRTRRFGLLRR